MSDHVIKMKVSARIVAVLAALLALVFSIPSRADTFGYASQRRQVKVAILYMNDTDADATPDFDLDNYAPFVFYVMDRRTDLKPAGWEFINPVAPSAITPAQAKRLQQRATIGGPDPTLASGQANVNAPLTKNLLPYWEVNLDSLSADDLQQFDILLLTIRKGTDVRFTPERSAKLARYVDSGGTLWLEDEGGGDKVTTDFIVNIGFNGQKAGSGLPVLASAHHPLVNYPYPISAFEATGLGVNGAAGYSHYDSRFPNPKRPPNPRILVPVVWSGSNALNSLPYISAGDYGAGHIVVSSAGVASGISSYVGGATMKLYGGNGGAVSGENLFGARAIDLKFAYNLVAWTSAVPTANNNVRRSSSTTENIGSLLGRKWQTVAKAAANPGSGAAIFKGVVFYVDGNNILHAYDANPANDLDNDQNPDDGIVDFSLDAPYDEIWNVNLNSLGNIGSTPRFSTPTIVSVLGNNGPVDIVTVTSSTGATLAFNAFPTDNTGKLQTTSSFAWNPVVGDTGNLSGPALQPGQQAPAPALSEGILFTLLRVAGNTPDTPWRVAAVNPIGGDSIFYTGTNAAIHSAPSTSALSQIAGLPNIIGPLTVGYVKDQPTGAMDKVIYAPATNGVGINKQPGFVNGMWFSTRSEPLDAIGTPDVNGNYLKFRPKGLRAFIPWFVDKSGNQELLPVLHLITKNNAGVVIGVTDLLYSNNAFTVTYSAGAGAANGMIVTLNSAVNPSLVSLYVDYTVDWPAAPIPSESGAGNVTPTAQMMLTFTQRGRFTVYDPNGANAQAVLTGSPVLSRNDLLVFNTTGLNSTGGAAQPDSVYGFRDQYVSGAAGTVGPGGPVVTWMWSPTGGVSSGLGSDATPPRLINRDIVAGAGSVAQAITGFTAIGSPAVSNGIVYVVGTAQMHTGILTTPVAVVLALRENPDTTFQAGQPIPVGAQVSLKQIDLVNSGLGNVKYLFLRKDTDFTVDSATGTIHVLNFRSQAAGESFNAALPIYVEVLGQNPATTPIVNTTTGYGPLDNLLWFTVIPSDKLGDASDTVAQGLPASGPSVIGNALYFGLDNGRVASVDLIGGSGGSQVTIYPLKPNGNPANLADYDQSSPRFHTQAVLVNAAGQTVVQSITNPPAAAANMVAVGTGRGIAGLENQIVLIADANRLLEVDSAGNAVWDLSATRSQRVAGGALPIFEGGDTSINFGTASGQVVTQKVSLARPNVARRNTLNTFLVADTANNRVIETDKGGNVIREIHTFQNGMNFLRPNDPMTLNAPTDIQTYTQSDLSNGGVIQIPNRDTGVTYIYTGAYVALHYIIADSGNFRALEIVDVYDPGTGLPITMVNKANNAEKVLMQKQVIFTTRSLATQNENLRYRTIQQFLDPSGLVYMVAAVSNVRQAALDPGTQAVGIGNNNVAGSGGSIVFLRRYPPAPFNDGDTQAVIDSLAFVDNTGAIVRRQPINNPTWFKAYQAKDPVSGKNILRYVLADGNGVYQLRASDDGKDAIVEWMLTNEDYLYMTGRPLRAASIAKLPQADYDSVTNRFYPHFLITNRYSGLDFVPEVLLGAMGVNLPKGEIHGEVVEVRSLDFYKGGYQTPNARLYKPAGTYLARNANSAIVWMTPNEIMPVNGAGVPVPGIIRRRIGSTDNASFTSLFEQPTFADRPF